jgi:multidrug efflux pump subunit AcrB
MMGLIGYCLRHPTAANLLMMLMLAAGLYGGVAIRTQTLPDTTIEMVNLEIAWPGAGPVELDRQVIALIGPQMLTLDGVVQTLSGVRQGAAWLNVFFRQGTDMGRAVDAVRAAVDGVGTLPADVEVTRIAAVTPRARVVDVMLWGDAPIEQLAQHAAALRDRLFRAGVMQISLLGAPDPVLRVDVPEMALVRHDLTLETIAQAVGGAMNAQPAGALGQGGARLRTGTAPRSLEAIGGIVLRRTADGAPLRLRDIATLGLHAEDDVTAYEIDGSPAIRLELSRLPGGDTLAIQAAAEAAVAAFRPNLPDGISVVLTSSRAAMIGERLSILVDNGLLGLGLVLLFLFLFLSARTAFWVAAGIPVAMAASLGLMYAAGLSLNMMSLFALIICLGVIVDDAIVVGEHADMLARRGANPLDAAEQAALRMLPPVLAASITTVVAFLSLTAIGGRFGTLIVVVPLTVSMVLLASLVESFLVLPAHMGHALAAQRRPRWYDAPSRWMNRGLDVLRERAFLPLTRWVIRARHAVLLSTLALFLHAVSMVTGGTVPWRFFNAPERGVLHANFSMLPGATRAEARAMLAGMRAALAETNAAFAAEYGTAPVLFATGTVGGVMGQEWALREASPGSLRGGLSVELIDPDRRPYAQGVFMARWAEAVPSHPRLESLAMQGARSGPGGEAIAVHFTGEDALSLKAAAEALRAALASEAAVAGLADNLPHDRAELALTLTPLGEALGLTQQDLGRTLRARLSGVEAARFPMGARMTTVRVATPEAALTADYPARALIRTPAGDWVPLEAVATVAPRLGFAEIRRTNGETALRVTGDFTTDDPVAQGAVRRLLEREILPEIAGRFDVGWRLGGLVEQERAFLSDAQRGFLLCLAGIYLVLAWIFGSWTRPLVVLLAIPLGFIGVIWGHHWMATPLSIFSVVGMIGMAGIVINDAIVLVGTADGYSRGRAIIPAILAAVADRLRAVFLTTATTVAGLAPMLFERSVQAQFLKPMAITLVFGLGFGMVLVLLVIPALLAASHDIARVGKASRRLLRLARRAVFRGACTP